jgi:hypothetical protein
MQFIYGISHFERDRGSFPALPLINLVTEQAETEESPSLQSRPGLQDAGVDFDEEGVTALYKVDGALTGDLFVIAGGKAFEGEDELGTVTGTGPARIAGFENFVFFNAGEDINSYDGVTYDTVSFPDGAGVLSIDVGASRLIAVRETSGTLYWSDPLTDGIDALSFATAESSPDFLLDLIYIGDRLVLFGSETVEIWEPTGDQDLPFQPVIGMVYSKGIKTTGACTRFNATFAWVTNTNQIVVSSPDNVISNPDLNTKIAASSVVRLWTFFIDGIEFLCLRLDNNSFVFNSATGLWSEFKSAEEGNWICQCYANGLFGSAVDGRLLEWSDDYSDFGEELERRFRAWAPILDGNISLDSVHLRLAPGLTPFLTGEYSEPVVELRVSGDGGYAWTSWLPRSMGRQGQYRKTTRWNSLGSYAFPGVLLELRVTDPVPFRVSGLYANQPGGNV